MRTVATYPLPGGSEIVVYEAGDSFRVEDHEIPPRWHPFTRPTEREACPLADRIANVYRYPNARPVES